MLDVTDELLQERDEARRERDDWRRKHAECTTSLITADRKIARLEAQLAEARAAVGEAWFRDEPSLAEAIARKTRKLEELANASDLEDVERDAIEALVAWIPSLYDAVGRDHLAATNRLADAGDRLIKARTARASKKTGTNLLADAGAKADR